MNGFYIEGKLPSLNEYIYACRSHWSTGAKMKKNTERLICYAVKVAVRKGKLSPVHGKCRIRFEWHEKTYRRDLDNIASAKKFILDALQEMEILPNDSARYVVGLQDDFIHDGKNGVYVELINVEESENDT